ncbi:NfeD family protein [Bacteroidota bacterium]
MLALTVILLIALGIVLLLVEFLLAPGVTVAGIGGFLMLVGGLILSYNTYGTPISHYILVGTLISVFLVLFITFRAKTWKKLMLDSKIDGVFNKPENDDIDLNIKPGDTGTAVTRLNPIGKVMVNDIVMEGKSIEGYIQEHSEIRVVKIENNRLIVKHK